MITPAFVFTIFMLTLGPIKTIPVFYQMTAGVPFAATRTLAIRGVAFATAICLFVALFMQSTVAAWHISLDALRIAGGVLLLLSSIRSVSDLSAPPRAVKREPATAEPKVLMRLAVSPLAIPTIVTPWGVVAILLFMGIAHGDNTQTLTVLIVLIGIMALNLAGMLAARPIMNLIGFGMIQVVGWVFAVLQAALAIEAILTALRHLGIVDVR